MKGTFTITLVVSFRILSLFLLHNAANTTGQIGHSSVTTKLRMSITVLHISARNEYRGSQKNAICCERKSYGCYSDSSYYVSVQMPL